MWIMTENGWRQFPTTGEWKPDKHYLEEQGIGEESIGYQYRWAVEEYLARRVPENQMNGLLSARRTTVKAP